MYIIVSSRNDKLLEIEEVLFSVEDFVCKISYGIDNLQIHNDNYGWCGIFGTTQNENSASELLYKYKRDQSISRENLKDRYLSVLIDKEKRQLIVTRDKIGKQHAFYASTANGFIVSTAIDPVISFLGKSGLQLRRESIELYLAFQYIPSPFTVFENILQIPISSQVKYSEGKVVVTKYQEHSRDIGEFSLLPGSTKNDLKTLLLDSFRNQGIYDYKNVGAFLSGGVDTSSNVSIMVEELKIKPKVFTAVFEDATYSEVEYARDVAHKFGLDHYVISIGPESAKYINEMIGQFDNPIGDRATLPQFILSKKAKEIGVDCMVSGEGGDEVLGYPRNLPEYIVPKDNLSSCELAKLYLSYSQLNSKEIVNSLLGIVEENAYVEEYLAEMYEELNSQYSFEKIYYGQWQTWLIENVLMKDHQIFKYFSIDYIAPFIDANIMSHMMSQSPYIKPSLLSNKSYLKTSLRAILPERVITKKKQKFDVPIGAWFKDSLADYLFDMLFVERSYLLEQLNTKVIKKMYKEHLSGESDFNRQLWALLVLDLWYKAKLSQI